MRLVDPIARRHTPVAMSYDPFDLDAQQEQTELDQAAISARAKQRDQDLDWLMRGPNGRRIAFRLLETTGIFRTSFSPNAMEMAKNEGLKQLGYWLLSEINRVCPQHYLTMLEERKQDRE